MWQLQLFIAVLAVILCGFVIFICGYTVTRLYFIIGDIQRKRVATKFNPKRRKNGIKTMIIAGSGGHTSEMMRMVESLNHIAYSPREYIVADTDRMSHDKIVTLEKNHQKSNTFSIKTVPRSREVKQSYITSVLTTLYATVHALPLVYRSKPDLILCNGPGTCIPICVAGFLMTLLGFRKVTIVFIESFCRVKSMSMSGKILYYFADHILVQWPELQEKYPGSRYIGQLM